MSFVPCHSFFFLVSLLGLSSFWLSCQILWLKNFCILWRWCYCVACVFSLLGRVYLEWVTRDFVANEGIGTMERSLPVSNPTRSDPLPWCSHLHANILKTCSPFMSTHINFICASSTQIQLQIRALCSAQQIMPSPFWLAHFGFLMLSVRHKVQFNFPAE